MTGKRDFDSRAAGWDKEPRRLRLAEDVATSILDACKITADMDAMDFGCGTGLLTLLLQPYVRTMEGIDSSPRMLEMLAEKVRERQLTNVRATLCDFERGERPAGRYHLIVSSMALHHIEDLPRLFLVFHHLLHPGGTICLADLDRESGNFHDDPVGVIHYGFVRPWVKGLLLAAGFAGAADRTAAVIEKARPGGTQQYPVFLISATKPER